MNDIRIQARYNGKVYDVAKLDMWGDPEQATCDLASAEEELFGIYLNEVEIIESTLEPFLGRLGKMAKDVEYMHNFQNEREDIVEYIYRTHEIIKILKGDVK